VRSVEERETDAVLAHLQQRDGRGEHRAFGELLAQLRQRPPLGGRERRDVGGSGDRTRSGGLLTGVDAASASGDEGEDGSAREAGQEAPGHRGTL